VLEIALETMPKPLPEEELPTKPEAVATSAAAVAAVAEASAGDGLPH
jgi:hypothetical protein